jgi:cytochrome c553
MSRRLARRRDEVALGRGPARFSRFPSPPPLAAATGGSGSGALPALLALAAGCWLLLAGAAARAAPAVEDTMAQRVIACTGCHGREGRAASDGYYPRIAGKPAGYLYNQLVNFRDGRRTYALMTHLVQHLTDGYLREIAAYFAGLDLPYPPPQPLALDATTRERGRKLVLEGDPSRNIPACAGCHGAALTGVAPAVPGLLGLPRDYLNSQLGAWRIDQRRAQEPDCMAQIARRLDAPDVAAITGWLASQSVPTPATPASSLPAPLPLRCGGVPGEVSADAAAPR